MILAGDIGGTKTTLALFDWTTERVEPVREETYPSKDYGTFEDVLKEFLETLTPAPASASEPGAGTEEETATGEPDAAAESPPVAPPVIAAACLGVAGPVLENRCRTTNLPWIVDGDALARSCAVGPVRLLNDLEAMAHGLLLLEPDEVAVLNQGKAPAAKTVMALIAAGTGLGEAILVWDGTRYRALPSEGGHADFAPNSDLEIELLRYMRVNFVHVSYERLLSGPGLQAIYEFLRDTKKNEPTWVAERLKVGDPAATIAEIGMSRQAEICVQALDVFVSIYGAEAGNLALKTLALDGVYIGGGIAPKLLTKMEEGGLLRAFTGKGRYKRLMSEIPVRVILNPRAGLLGAAAVAAELSRSAGDPSKE